MFRKEGAGPFGSLPGISLKNQGHKGAIPGLVFIACTCTSIIGKWVAFFGAGNCCAIKRPGKSKAIASEVKIFIAENLMVKVCAGEDKALIFQLQGIGEIIVSICYNKTIMIKNQTYR